MINAGTAARCTDTGWSNSVVFQDYLQHHFLKHVPGGTSEPTLLLYDGHSSHINAPLIDWAQKHIILFLLPAHTSHLLQPLDVGIFGAFKNVYYQQCREHMRAHPGQIVSRYDICHLTAKAYSTALNPRNIIAGFKRTGVFPFNPSVIAEDNLNPSLAVNQSTDGRALIDITGIEGFLAKRVPVCGKPTVKRSQTVVMGGQPLTEGPAVAQIKQMAQRKKAQPAKNAAKVPQPTKAARSKKSTGQPIADGQVEVQSRQITPKRRAARTTTTTTPKKPRSDRALASTSTGIRAPSSPIHTSDTQDENIPDQEVCCVCKKQTPPTMNMSIISIVQWAQCDRRDEPRRRCHHWVHHCTSVRQVSYNERFWCPCCM